MKETKHRIISCIPSITETLYDLGLENEIVGITAWCSSPFHFKSTKELVVTNDGIDFEAIKTLEPTIILLNPTDFSGKDVEALQLLAPVHSIDVRSYNETINLIKELGKLFNKNTDAQKWIDKIDFAKQSFDDFIQLQPKQKVAYILQKNPYLSVNKDTYEQAILELNRFENIYAHRSDQYPEIEIQKIRIQGDPDLVFLPSHLYYFTEEDVFEIGRFTHHGKTIFVEGRMFSWYGTRIYQAFEYFKKIHQRIKE